MLFASSPAAADVCQAGLLGRWGRLCRTEVGWGDVNIHSVSQPQLIVSEYDDELAAIPHPPTHIVWLESRTLLAGWRWLFDAPLNEGRVSASPTFPHIAIHCKSTTAWMWTHKDTFFQWLTVSESGTSSSAVVAVVVVGSCGGGEMEKHLIDIWLPFANEPANVMGKWCGSR